MEIELLRLSSSLYRHLERFATSVFRAMEQNARSMEEGRSKTAPREAEISQSIERHTACLRRVDRRVYVRTIPQVGRIFKVAVTNRGHSSSCGIRNYVSEVAQSPMMLPNGHCIIKTFNDVAQSGIVPIAFAVRSKSTAQHNCCTKEIHHRE